MEKVNISKNKFFLWSVIIAVLNPVFSGLVLGLVMFSEPELRKEGRIVTVFSIIWGVIVLLLINRFRHLLL